MKLVMALAWLLSFGPNDFKLVSDTNNSKVWELHVSPKGEWHELVPSWNVACPAGTYIHVEVKLTNSNWYSMGYWSSDGNQKRESVQNQKDEIARVDTDTLIPKSKSSNFTVRVTAYKNNKGEEPEIKYFGISLLNNERKTDNTKMLSASSILDVPERSQLGHKDGQGWCSPTCISMILAYWGKDFDVPTTAAAVHDPNWTGTGNWSFNMAYAGQFPGMRAVTHRLDNLEQVHDLVNAGIPVPISVSFDYLNGKEKDEGNGHLVVVIGFDGKGNVIINDPWPDPSGINRIRKSIPISRVAKAWQRSKQTAYLVAPEQKLTPHLKKFAN